MNAVLVPSVLALVLVISAFAGPRLIRTAAPLLMRVPRLAVMVLVAGVGFWALSVASLSLMLAWTVTGPSILPAPAADVCQRCLAAASPFGTVGTIDTVIPSALLLLLPALGALVATAIGIRRSLAIRRRTRVLSREILATARLQIVSEHRVLVLDDERPIAFSLPRRSGGVVVSTGLVTVLDADELAAVLTHEQEHVRGKHHLVLSLLDLMTASLRWVPLARDVAHAVPHYLEIAADNAARRQTGTPTLAGALLKLGSPDKVFTAAHVHDTASPVLHAAGTDRIARLVRPPRLRPAVLPAAALALLLAAFSAAAVAVHGPYLSVILTGCHLPAS
ncbi:M56 family metallopeptidase [Microbacterium sp. ZW T5_45]|uniref:M56 family metallopeptidase n=1 Tax=Microbacterium sp. ZW T5_45 TaxID=3378080 RepID=UPI003852F683